MILLVDDDEEFLVQAQLSLADVTEDGLLFAENANRTARLLERLHDEIALVMVDLNLKDSDGFNLISELRKKYPDLPSIAFSGVKSKDVLASAKVLGATEVLQKPITPEWKDTISRLLHGLKQHRMHG